MDLPVSQQLERIIGEIQEFGKENLEEILHKLVDGIQILAGSGHCRIYLEDLTMGALTCATATSGELDQLKDNFSPINNSDYSISQVYQQKRELDINDLSQYPHDLPLTAGMDKIKSTYLLPITQLGRSIGVLCLDRTTPEQLPSEGQLHRIRKLLAETTPMLNRARKYQQQLLLARKVDEAKKREAALFMVKSAAQLIDQVALASVLIPVPSTVDGERTMQILASYSKEREARKLYEEERLINLSPGESLLSSFIDRAGVIADDSLLAPFYISDLAAETLQKSYLTKKLGLKSLYMVPRYDKRTRRVICLVNYYTKEQYQFSPFERDLLDAHAEMAQRVVQEIGNEHLEVQVLAEIRDLLHQSNDSLQPFLHRVLSKATQLIGADTGSIALIREQQGERWLAVEDSGGKLIGAKNRDWLKQHIPQLRVGGEELPLEQRSLSGLAAVTAKAQILVDSLDIETSNNFYQPVTEAIRSEIAVPVIYDSEVLAVICLDSLRPHFFTSEHKRILLIIERMIGHHLAILQKIEQLTSQIDRLRQDVDYKDPNITSYRMGNIIGNSTKTQEVIDTIQRFSQPICQRIINWKSPKLLGKGELLGLPSILITGETGAGKEFLFNNLFDQLNQTYRKLLATQNALPLKKTNIAAYSGELTYSELFGHKRGAFTGAHSDRRGIFEEANGGVVFLDEIGDADPKTQVQLLRFLDSGEFIRLGENITRHSKVLLVAGTNRDLRQLIADGSFREDLFHRLSELIIEVPSLNQRREDIPDLAVHFLGRLYQAYYQPDQDADETPILTVAAKGMLKRHHYTGNIRELRSILLRAMLLRESKTISTAEIERAIQPQTGSYGDKTDAKRLVIADQAAEEIFKRILANENDFWDAVYQPYSEQELTREVVIKLVEKARAEGATNMPKLARLLRACDPDDNSSTEKKQFYRFKNFLYKTVRIN
ncbi:MAG: GPMC system transcriptional regulator [Desulfuromonadales bacterium]|nr:GPMC system transcriptional regulator [Desulfuromonadales bacterium]